MNATDSPAKASSGGKLVVVGMLLVAVLAGAFAWWWNYDRGRRAMAFYGPDAAKLIRTAPVVELLTVESGVTAPQSLDGRGRGRTIDVSRAAGLVHARASLLDDASYDWDAPASQGSSDPMLVRFTNGNDEALVYLYLDERTVVASPSGRSALLVRKTADGWRQFIERNLAAGVEP